jgi:hypothetical protein
MSETSLAETGLIAPAGESHPGLSTQSPKRAGKQHFAVRLPTVNLLSPASLEELALRQLRRRFVLGAVALMILLGLGWAVQSIRVAQAEQELVAQQRQTAGLTAEVNALAPVRLFYAAVDQQKETVTRAMASEVLLSNVMAELRAQTPTGVRVETLSVEIQPSTDPRATEGGAPPDGAPGGSAPTGSSTAPGSAGRLCPTPEPFAAAATVGCATIGGSADSREAVGALVIRLGDSDLFVGPFISASNVSGDGRVIFTGTVGVTEKVFSGRYADPGWMTPKRGAE